jgi:hypothetical protein
VTGIPDDGRSAQIHHHDADRIPVGFQRVENAALVVLTVAAFVHLGFDWWWLLVLFLVFDLSTIGYARDARIGAWSYNAVHNYGGPGLLGAVGILADLRWALFVALAWAFHVAVDRMLGYGLKFTDRFTHTHLGEVGKRRP